LTLDLAQTERPRRARVWLYVRIAITLAAFALLVRYVSLDELMIAVRRIPLGALTLCILIVLIGQIGSVVRFQLLLDAYGADEKLHFLESLRLYLVATFYNTYLPGAVAGDVMRAISVRECFRNGGLTSAFAVSFAERVTGFASMLALTAGVSLVRPIPGIEGLFVFSMLGLLGAAAALGAIVVGRRAERYLPPRLASLAANLPAIRSLGSLFAAAVAALATHAATAIAFHVIIASLTAKASLAESLVIIPLAWSATYIPATIAGAGTRDAAFVLLYGRVGVEAADALAMSLAGLVCTFVVAGLGGIATFFPPYRRR
jgi:uncharacterized membrane protein YbhN (UPF0104 family)